MVKEMTKKKKDEKKTANRGGSAFKGRKEVGNTPVSYPEKQLPTERAEEKPAKDLFGDWDIRRDTSVREQAPKSAQPEPEEYSVKQTEDNYPRYHESKEDRNGGEDSLDTPPFFRKRRR